MSDSKQMIFSFPDDAKTRLRERRRVIEYRRAVVAWLACQKPSGIALKVPTRFSKYLADIAAFWSVPRKKLFYPQKTVIVEIRTKREKCWPDCSNKEELLPRLRELKEAKKSLEAIIRKTEPELRDDDNLFDDFEIWSYERSKNKDYQHCRRTIEETEHALYQGSRFERIRRAHVADYLYLAVPCGVVHPHELADGWGLIYLDQNYGVDVIKEAEPWHCPEENKLHLVQNIASATLESVLFSLGIVYDSRNGETAFVPIPHRRRYPGK